jgi:hypothetical protein
MLKILCPDMKNDVVSIKKICRKPSTIRALMYQERLTVEITDNKFLLDIQELLADDDDDTFLIECAEQFETVISATGPNNELIDKNICTDKSSNINTCTINEDNTCTINERNEHDDQDANTNNDRDVSNEFLMEGGEWLWQEFLQLPQSVTLEMIQSNEKPFDAVQDAGLINNGKSFQFLLPYV